MSTLALRYPRKKISCKQRDPVNMVVSKCRHRGNQYPLETCKGKVCIHKPETFFDLKKVIGRECNAVHSAMTQGVMQSFIAKLKSTFANMNIIHTTLFLGPGCCSLTSPFYCCKWHRCLYSSIHWKGSQDFTQHITFVSFSVNSLAGLCICSQYSPISYSPCFLIFPIPPLFPHSPYSSPISSQYYIRLSSYTTMIITLTCTILN